MTLDTQKLLALLSIVDGAKDKTFLSAAFPDASESDINEALVSLSLEGMIQIQPEGISLAKPIAAELQQQPSIQSEQEISPEEDQESPLGAPLWTVTVDQLNLREPVARNLKRSHIWSVQELIDCTEEDLMQIRGMGIKKINEVKDALSEINLGLKKGNRTSTSSNDPIYIPPKDPVPLDKWIESLKPAHRSVIEGRLAGKKLRQVGEELDITRERVRQIQTKELQKRPPITEDSYRYLFDSYAFTEDAFCKATNEPTETFNYLKLTANSKGVERKPLSEMLDDPKVPEMVKETLLGGQIDDDFLYVDGVRIAKNKQAIAAHLVQHDFCGGPVLLNDLFDKYLEFLEQNDCSDDKRLDPTNRRAFYTTLERNKELLVTPSEETGEGSIARSFDTTKNFTTLIDAIANLANLNIECSTNLLLKRPEIKRIADDLDIRNGNELHAVLASFDDELPNVKFGRMPMITLGEADRSDQVLELIKELSPISGLDLSNEYERKFGVKAATFYGTYLKDFKSYLHDGKYVYEEFELTPEQKGFIRSEISRNNGYMALDYLKSQFSLKFNELPDGYLNKETLEQANCRISAGLVIDNDLDMAEMFQKLIDKNDYINLNTPGISEEVFRNQEFLSELNKAKRRFEVIEYDADHYLCTRILSELPHPVDTSDMQDFMEKALEWMESRVPYTGKSLRESGFDHPLFNLIEILPVKDRFYESVLAQGYVGGRLKRTNFGNCTFFCKKDGWFTIADVLEYEVAKRQTIDLDDLRQLLNETYGLDTTRQTLLNTIHRSALNWDSSTSFVRSAQFND